MRTVEHRGESGRGTVRWRGAGRVSWHIEARHSPEPFVNRPRLWHAWFDHHTPEHLVSASSPRSPIQPRSSAACTTAPPTTA
ncbi:DUF317 domain-containing protein [Streptomyces sp. NPDC091266]|uniref:DUF317 domain-containing protein n=1 Tax=Streptomyces sp. NPDC091266 TaxID=3365978 RepID=UPI0038299304